jgi:quercetin dioxygenase-like cupin family protein
MNAELDFELVEVQEGLLADLGSAAGNPRIYGWRGGELRLTDDATHFGMVLGGAADVTDDLGTLRLTAGMYFVIPGQCQVHPFRSQGLVITCPGYRGLRQFGGPPEPAGRLRYIDGCSDTLLVCPPRRGEPCLNSLHVPPRTRQSAHTHPSDRIGVILRGRGECHTPRGVYPLTPGMGWRIPAGVLHAFVTHTDSLDILAWHPDSDFGPTDEDHPMLNRTVRQN